MTAAVCIDLGFDRAPPDVDAIPRASRYRRSARISTLLTILMLAVAGGAPMIASFGPFTSVPSEYGDRSVILGDRLYLLSVEPDRTLSAYELPSARRLWTAGLVARGQVRQVLEVGSAVLVTTFQSQTGSGRLASFDRRTGALRWQSDSRLVDPVDSDTILVYSRDASSDASTPAAATPTTVVGVDVNTRAIRWSRDIPAQARFERIYVDGGLRRAVQVPAGSRTADVYAGSTGILLASATIAPDGAILLDVRGIGATLLVRYAPAGGGPYRLAGFTLDTLAPLWTIESPVREFDPVDCAPDICLRRWSGGTVAVDPGSGRVRWSSPRPVSVPAARGLLSATPGGGMAVLEPGTGRIVAESAEWWPLGAASDGATGRGATGDGPASDGPAADRWIVARSGNGAATIYIGMLDSGRGRIRTLGSADGVLRDTCRTGTGVVVCDLLSGGVGIWPYQI